MTVTNGTVDLDTGQAARTRAYQESLLRRRRPLALPYYRRYRSKIWFEGQKA